MPGFPVFFFFWSSRIFFHARLFFGGRCPSLWPPSRRGLHHHHLHHHHHHHHCHFMTPGLALEDAVPPSDLHLDEDFDKLEDRDKSRKGADTFLKQIKKWSSRHFLSQYTKLLFSELPTRPETEPEHSWRKWKKTILKKQRLICFSNMPNSYSLNSK